MKITYFPTEVKVSGIKDFLRHPIDYNKTKPFTNLYDSDPLRILSGPVQAAFNNKLLRPYLQYNPKYKDIYLNFLRDLLKEIVRVSALKIDLKNNVALFPRIHEEAQKYLIYVIKFLSEDLANETKRVSNSQEQSNNEVPNEDSQEQAETQAASIKIIRLSAKNPFNSSSLNVQEDVLNRVLEDFKRMHEKAFISATVSGIIETISNPQKQKAQRKVPQQNNQQEAEVTAKNMFDTIHGALQNGIETYKKALSIRNDATIDEGTKIQQIQNLLSSLADYSEENYNVDAHLANIDKAINKSIKIYESAFDLYETALSELDVDKKIEEIDKCKKLLQTAFAVSFDEFDIANLQQFTKQKFVNPNQQSNTNQTQQNQPTNSESSNTQNEQEHGVKQLAQGINQINSNNDAYLGGGNKEINKQNLFIDFVEKTEFFNKLKQKSSMTEVKENIPKYCNMLSLQLQQEGVDAEGLDVALISDILIKTIILYKIGFYKTSNMNSNIQNALINVKKDLLKYEDTENSRLKDLCDKIKEKIDKLLPIPLKKDKL